MKAVLSQCSASYLASIVGSAVQTFLRHEIKSHLGGLSAVIAENPNLLSSAPLSNYIPKWPPFAEKGREKKKNTYQFVLIWFRHWCSSNLQVKFLPYL